MRKSSPNIGLIVIPKIVLGYSNLLYPSLALAHLGSYLNRKGYNTTNIPFELSLMADSRLYDYFARLNEKSPEELKELASNKENLPIDSFFHKLNLGSYDLLGISCSLNKEMNFFVFLITRIKKLFPNIILVLGGLSRFRYKFKEFLESKIIDFLVIGSGEEPFEQIINRIESKTSFEDIGRIIYFDGSKLIDNSDAEFKIDFSIQSIFFDKNYLDRFRLFAFNSNILNNIFLNTLIPYYFSEGCPYNCAFCSKSIGNYFFCKSPESIIQEIKSIKESTGLRYFAFLDDELAISNKFIGELCDRMIEANLDILWIASIRGSPFLTQETFHKMRKAGCICLDFGLETGSDKVLKKINKGLTSKNIETALKYSHNAGIWDGINIIVGIPTETEEDFRQTIKFMKDNEEYINWAFLNTYVLVPSIIQENPEEFGIKIRPMTQEMHYDEKMMYDKIDGRTHEEIARINKERMHRLIDSLPKSSYKSMIKARFLYNEIIFPLYDHLKSKDKVVNFIEKNFNLLSKYSGEYFALPLGLASNQMTKETTLPTKLEELKFLPKEQLLSKLDSIKSEGFKKLIICGGEPLIHPHLIEILTHAKKLGFETIVKSNARMLKYDEFCSKVSSLIDELLVIDYSSEESEYENISQVKGSFLQSRQGIDNWKKTGNKLSHYC